jgi:hypothetical protein
VQLAYRSTKATPGLPGLTSIPAKVVQRLLLVRPVSRGWELVRDGTSDEHSLSNSGASVTRYSRLARAVALTYAVCFLFVGTARVAAQEPSGRISGQVIDPGGHLVPNYRVELERPRSYGPGRLVATTDVNGHFDYANLRLGRYKVILTRGQQVVASDEVELSAERLEVDDLTVKLPALSARRTSAARLLRGRPRPENFEALSALLAPGGYGYEVIVTDQSGVSMRGRISSISGDAVVLNTGPTLPLVRALAPTERRFDAESVTRIEMVDSVWNGFLIGTAGMLAGLFVVPHMCSSFACGSAVSALWMGLVPLVGVGVDQVINQPIYERPSQPPRVTIAPLSGAGQTGVVAQVRFGF